LLLNLDGVVAFVFLSVIIPWGRRNVQRARARNVEICQFSQERIKALLFVVPVDLGDVDLRIYPLLLDGRRKTSSPVDQVA
jgi:hypothetical protein